MRVVRRLDSYPICSDIESCSDKSITKNNWYPHSLTCKAYLALGPGVDGAPKTQTGKITLSASVQAGPSGLNHSVESRKECAAPRRKRKAAESDEDNKLKAQRKIKVYTFSFASCTCSLLLICDVLHSESGARERVDLDVLQRSFPLQLFARLYYPASLVQSHIFTIFLCCSAIYHGVV
jgi:hypothetical protein